MKATLLSIGIVIGLLLTSTILFSFAQPLHIPFLGSQDQIDEDRAITTFLITGNEEQIAFLTPNELSHMVDVKRLLDVAVLIILSILVACFLLLDRKTHLRIRYVPIYSLIVFAILPLLPFAQLFARFHELFFPQGNYTFAYDSILITTYPESFFFISLISIVVIYIVLAIVFARMQIHNHLEKIV